MGGLHRCLAPLPAPGLKLGPLKVACVGVALVEGWGTSLGCCPDRVSGLGSAGVLLTRPGLESCRRLSPRRGLALTPPPLRSSTNRARWARTARSSSPTSPPEWVALDSSRRLLLPLVRDAPSAGVGGHLNFKTLQLLSVVWWLSRSMALQALRFAFPGTEQSVCNIYYPCRFQQLLLALARPPGFRTPAC